MERADSQTEIRTFSGALPPDFRAFCLRHELWEQTHQNSRFLALFKGTHASMGYEEVPAGFIAAVVSRDGTPVGLGLLERRQAALPAEVWRTLRSGRNVIEQAHPWVFRVVGRTGFYVKPEYRQLGIGTRLLHAVEGCRLDELDPVLDGWSTQDVATTIAEARAYELGERHSHSFRCLPTEKDCLWRRREMATLIHDLKWLRLGVADMGTRPLPEWSEWPQVARHPATRVLPSPAYSLPSEQGDRLKEAETAQGTRATL